MPPGYGGHRALLEQFEQLAIGGGVGPTGETDTSTFPRPAGPEFARAYAPQPKYDRGNCSPINMRPTVNAIPASTALRARWQLPLGVVVHPMADEAHGGSVPVIPLSTAGIVRCRRCRTYMNPFMPWTDGGRRFKCNVCALFNEVGTRGVSGIEQALLCR